ncbi:MAG: ATP-binding protein [Lachnospiraceae bacterium]|nr:ATP-binding protein [Lachnospiraceae bacterium]
MAVFSDMSEIQREYEDIRFHNRQLHDDRVDEIHEKIPQIEEIDGKIRDLSIDAALAKLNEESVDEEDLKTQSRLLIEEKYRLLQEYGYPKDYLEPIYTCSICKDTGSVGNETCECMKKRIIRQFYDRSNLAKNTEQDNFDNFHIEYYSTQPDGKHKLSPRENIENVRLALKSYIQGVSSYFTGETTSKGNLLFQGTTGVGKTFLTNCTAKELLDRGYTVLYSSAGSLFDQIADVVMNRDQIEGSRIFYQALADCDVLIIDDLGTEFTNGFTNAHLYDLINNRLLNRKATIISTNLSLQQITEHYSERISSRIYDSYLILQIYGEDIRLAKRKKLYQDIKA